MMQSLFLDCCYGPSVPQGQQESMVGIENLREYVERDAMNIDQLMLSPNHGGSVSRNNHNNKSFETPPRPTRKDPECPGAPRRKPRDDGYQEDQIYPIPATAAPLFPFDDFERVDSMDSTIPAPRRLFDLEPKFLEPVLVEEHINNESSANLILPDEEREEDETRQDHDSDDRDA